MGLFRGRGVVLVLALVAALLAVGCGGGDGNGLAHVNEATGSTNGVPLDEREGTPPPPVKQTNLKKLAEEAGCFLLPNLPEEGNEEVAPGTPSPQYKAALPTSGTHVEEPHQQADGAYTLAPEPIDFVASLDHGRVEIQYAPDLSEEIQLELKGLYDTMYGGVLLFPNESMDFAVAATAWRALLGCTTWEGDTTLDAIRAFGKATWGKRGSKSVDEFPVEGPTPRNPEEPDAG